ncbi:MAG: hypothetical protein K1X81_03415 [Bacteroidia bacterium]|nr:hypothetical protein [Bacteroidia bacterium]
MKNGSFETYVENAEMYSVNGPIYYINGPAGFVKESKGKPVSDTASDGEVYSVIYLWHVNSLYKHADANLKGDIVLPLDTNWGNSGPRRFVLKIDVRTSEDSKYATNKLNYRLLNYGLLKNPNEFGKENSCGTHHPLYTPDSSFFPKRKWVTLTDTITFFLNERQDFIYIGGIPNGDIITFKKMKGTVKSFILIDIDNIRLIPIKD